MIEKVHDLIIKETFKNNHKKINEKETLEEYLSSFKNEELTRLSITHVWFEDNIEELIEVHNLNKKPKKDIIKYITDDLYKIFSIYGKILCETDLKDLTKIVDDGGNYKVSFDDFEFPLSFINLLNNLSLAKIYYDEKNEMLQIFINKDITNVLKDILHDKDIINYNKQFNEICGYTEGVLNAYGVVPLSVLHELFEKQMYKIDIEELNKVIGGKALFDEIFNMCEYDNDMLIGGLDFYMEDEIINFYNKQEGEYKYYSKRDFLLLKDDKYMKSFKSYKNLIKYLKANFEGIDNTEEIDMFVIMDYISTAQISVEDADDNFNNNIDELFEVDEIEKTRIRNMVRQIFNEYPKWKKRGNK